MIGLMDCNNFFVSCERLFRPDLLKRPVAVLSSNDGCIVARSQEIKDLGIPMGVPYFQVKSICEEAKAVLFSSNFPLYRDISSRVMRVLADEVGTCEIYSIDEAFFTLPENVFIEEVARIRARVMQQVGIPVSIGVATTKTLAKQASVRAKKSNGVFMLSKENWALLKHETSCASVWNLGRQTATKLREMGVTTVSEFLALDPASIERHFGVMGRRLQKELQGIRVYDVGHNSDDIQKSIMSTRSFEKTTTNLSDLESAVGYHVSFVAKKLREKKLCATRISVALQTSRHGDFMLHSGYDGATLQEPSNSTSVLLSEALREVANIYRKGVPYKKAGVVLSGLMPESYRTPNLFRDEEEHVRDATLDTVVDALNDRFGKNAVHRAVVKQNPTRTSMKLRSKEYTTKWEDIPSVSA